MIYITDTPNHAGVTSHGDYMDLEELYDALHKVVGEEGQRSGHTAVRLRVLGICYEIRHAMMGTREIEFVDNGMNPSAMKQRAMITHTQNVYMSFQVLWPEVLFVSMALNDYLSGLEGRYRGPSWDPSAAVVRKFQAAVAVCFREMVSETVYKRTIKLMNDPFTGYSGYCTQYVDLLNVRFLKMDPEKRLKSISSCAKRMSEKPNDYWQLKADVERAAREYNCPAHDIMLEEIVYPEDIEW